MSKRVLSRSVSRFQYQRFSEAIQATQGTSIQGEG